MYLWKTGIGSVKQKSLGYILHTGGTCYLDKLNSAFCILSDITQVLFWPISFSSKRRSSDSLILEKEKRDLDVRTQALLLKGNSVLLSFSSPHTERFTLNEISECPSLSDILLRLCLSDILLRLCQGGLSLAVIRE